MGLLIGIAIAGVVLAILWRGRFAQGPALQLVAAALLLGLAGYALQGRVGLSGSPAAERPAKSLPPAMPIELAGEFYGRFNAATPWLAIANGYMLRGDSEGAVATLTSAVRAIPRSSELWIALGNALVTHNGGRPSPASELAYERSAFIAPRHPAPRFFYGLMLLQQGAVDRTLVLWKQVLAEAPPSASWRAGLAARMAMVETLRRQEAPTSSQ